MNANVFSIGDEDDDVEYGTYVWARVCHYMYTYLCTYICMYGLSRCTAGTYVCATSMYLHMYVLCL